MRKIRDVPRLKASGLSKRKIAASIWAESDSVWRVYRLAQVAGLSWPLPEGLTDEALERRLYRMCPHSGQGSTASAGLREHPLRA
jgi:hypothetical protein